MYSNWQSFKVKKQQLHTRFTKHSIELFGGSIEPFEEHILMI